MAKYLEFDPEVSSINLCVAWYLMASYLYYECDESLMTDHDFDLMCKRLLEEFDNITHPHKEFLNRDNLSAGSGYGIEYTNMIKNAARTCLEETRPKRKEKKTTKVEKVLREERKF